MLKTYKPFENQKQCLQKLLSSGEITPSKEDKYLREGTLVEMAKKRNLLGRTSNINKCNLATELVSGILISIVGVPSRYFNFNY
jgi:hypothetical protein